VRRRTAFACWCALLLALAPAAGAQEGTPDLPAGPGTISGHVLRATSGDPVPDVEVVVYALTAEGIPGLRRARSGPDGSFRFENVSNADGISYLLGGRYAGVPFPGARVRFEPDATEATADVRITELTDDPGQVKVTAVELRVLRDAQGLRVLEAIEFSNTGAQTYSVPRDAHADARPAFTTEIPEAASAFQMPLGVIPEGLVRDGAEIAYYGPIYPGVHDLSWAFSIPGETQDDGTERFVLEGRVPEATPLRLLVPTGQGEVDASGWTRAAEPHLADGREHTRYDAEGGRFRAVFVLPPAVVNPDAVHLTESQLILDVDDVAINVRETVTLEADEGAIALGTEAHPLARIAVPPDATDVRFGTDASGVQLVPHPDGGLAAIGSTGPGRFQVEVRYRRPVEAVPIVFEHTSLERIPRLSIFVGDTGEWALSSDRLHRRRPVRTSDLSYLHMEAFEVLPGETVRLAIERLAPRSTTGHWLALAVTAVLGVVAILWLSMPLRAESGLDDDPDAVSPEAREREATIAAIRDLDHDFETGKIAEADHAEMRATLRARAIELLRLERAAEATAAGGAAGGATAPPDAVYRPAAPQPDATEPGGPDAFCPACGAAVAAQHRFCANCGQALAGATPPEAP